ncbi:hypothetical protein [Kitasatospora sp. NPDC051914]|uniref:hypothetical protein n=1 Tax=Kitasatospora sp. NPDC051914 TaxID=3154945 RepID=UPI0034462EBB
MTRTQTALLCAATLFAATLQTTAGAATAAPSGGRDRQTCEATPGPLRGPARRIDRIVRETMEEFDLKSVLFKVTEDGREIVTGARGESMTSVPAEPGMHFRSGPVAIAVSATKGPGSPDQNNAQVAAERISELLAPENPLVLA